MVELQLLNKILQNGDPSPIVLNRLDDSFFPQYPKEFDFIKSHYEEHGNVPDMASFLDHFPSFEVIKVNETDRYLIGELYKEHNGDVLAAAFNKVRALLQQNRVDEAMEAYKKAEEGLTQGRALQSTDLVKDTSRYQDYLDRTQDFRKFYISTGFPELDAIVGGYDRQDELALVVARTNVGKSQWLMKSAVAALKQGLNVGMYSGEMSERKVGYRFDTAMSGIPNGSISHGNIGIKQEYEKYIGELPSMAGSGSFKVITPQSIAGPANVDALKAFIEKERLDILFVDQISLLEDQRRGKTPTEKYANISKDLKLLQTMKRIPIVSVSQQNRTASESGNADTTQIAMSDRLGQDATMVVFLEKKDAVIKMTLVKSRDSENGKSLNYNVDFNTGKWQYIPEEGDGNPDKPSDYESRYEPNPDAGEDCF